MDFIEVSMLSRYLGDRLRASSWLTFLGSTVVEQLGGVSYVYGRARGGEAVVIEQRGPAGARAGETIAAGFAPRDLRVFGPDGQRLR